MMNGIQGIPRVTTQGCGFFNFFQRIHLGWSKTFATFAAGGSMNQTLVALSLPKIAQFALGSEERCGVWVIFFFRIQGC